MNFLNRLKYYLIGVGLGILVVMAIFKDRNLTKWMPENQVIGRIMDADLQFTSMAECQLECLKMDSVQLKKVIESGDVKFGQSEVSKEQKIYKIEFEEEKIQFIEVKFLEKAITVVGIKATDMDCGCAEG